MNNPYAGPLDALEGLLEERKRYEDWIGRLDDRRAGAPGHVLQRVRGDYEERLRGVMEQLRSRATELESSATSMRERIAALLDEENARRDERAEAELRAEVGEFSAEYAGDLLARCDEAIGRLSGERGNVEAELRRVEEILALVRRPTAADVPAHESAAPQAPAPAAPEPPPAQPAPGGSFDELAFLQSVVQPRPVQPAPSAPSSGADYLAPTPLAGVRRAASSGEPMSARDEGSASRTVSATPEDVPSFLKDVPTEQVKTLKCQECGTMNYATEWYCERCGGELAAM
jgi:hypothetical protein